MSAAAFAQFGVFCAASRIVLHGDARPVVEGIGEAVVAGLAAHDDATLAGTLGDRRDPCQTSQGGIISPLQRLPGFGEQRGEDGPSHSRQGCEDRRVMLLLPAPARFSWRPRGCR